MIPTVNRNTPVQSKRRNWNSGKCWSGRSSRKITVKGKEILRRSEINHPIQRQLTRHTKHIQASATYALLNTACDDDPHAFCKGKYDHNGKGKRAKMATARR
jgi:hypothetical protein